MSDARFTPGPWHTDCDCEGIFNTHCNFICDLPLISANAHLIAASPDLYEALEECLKWLESSPEGENATRMALAALAKARGEL